MNTSGHKGQAPQAERPETRELLRGRTFTRTLH